MSKFLTLSLSCVILVGCSVVRKSPTWNRVVNTPRVTADSENRSLAFAGELHAELHQMRVPHKVVTYDYPYHSKYDGKGTAQRTSVIYRDDASPKYPWWIMDERLKRPVWLPSETVQNQVSFFLRRPATIVTLRDYTESGEKIVAPVERPRKQAVTRIQRESEPAPRVVVKPAAVRPVLAKPAAVKPVIAKPDRVEPEVEAPATPEAPKRSLFRPAGVPLRPLFSN